MKQHLIYLWPLKRMSHFIALASVAASCGLESIRMPPDDSSDRAVSTPYYSDTYPSGLPSGSIRPFQSLTELEDYIRGSLVESKAKQDKAATNDGTVASDSASQNAPSESQTSSSGNETITNNQESGVDEGGIVKNIGNYLVTLRRGRLYAVNVERPGQPTQTDAMNVAPHAALPDSVWYDELLVKGDLLVVVGYRYLPYDATIHNRTGTTELNLFQLTDGKFRRVASRFQESWDYFSGHNYSSRMVDGKLFLYSPTPAYQYKASASTPHIPHLFKLTLEGRIEENGDLFAATDVFAPVEVPYYPIYHTVTRCGIDAKDGFSCKASALLSCGSRENYVTSKTAYIWSCNHVYAMDLGSGRTLTHKTSGAPLSQFSFKESEGKLSLVTGRKYFSFCGVGQHNQREDNSPLLSFLSLSLSDFNDTGDQELSGERVRVLLDKDAAKQHWWPTLNRFVAGKVLIASQRWSNETTTSQLLVADLNPAIPSKAFEFSSSISRIEVMGLNRALIATQGQRYGNWQGSQRMALQPVFLSGEPQLGEALSLDSPAQGEWRSHGFFYKGNEDNSGTLGLAVMNPEVSSGRWWENGSSVAFAHVGTGGKLTSLGASSPTPGGNSPCASGSCIDWYGNTRPIFLKDRVFSLMGSEIQENKLAERVEVLGSAQLQ